MVRTSTTYVQSELEETPAEVEPVEIDTVLTYNDVQPTVKLRSRFPARLRYNGQVTGQRYEWSASGAIQIVDARDAQALLQMKIGVSTCCGGTHNNGNTLFELLPED